MTTIEQSESDAYLLESFQKFTSNVQCSHSSVDGADLLRLQMLYLERLTHFVRSKISIPSAVIRDQLAGEALVRRDFEDGAEAIESIISTLESLNWGLSPEAPKAVRVPATQALRQITDPKEQRDGKMTVLACGAELEYEESPLLLRADELQQVCRALCRYMHSFTLIPLEVFLSCCSLSLQSGSNQLGSLHSESGRSQSMLLSAAISPGQLRQTRMAPYLGQNFNIEQLIELDHSVSSLLLFSPFLVVSLEGLSAKFEPSQTALQFRLSAAEPMT